MSTPSPGAQAHDLADVALRQGALTARLDRIEELVEGQGAALDAVEDFARTAVDRLDARAAPSAPPASSNGDGNADGGGVSDGPAIDIDVLTAWVHDNIAQLIERKVRGRVDAGPHWCPQWWRHPEAILRFEALRRAWEVLVPQGGTALVAYLGHLDQTLSVLMADAGAFHAGSCKHDRHNGVAVLGDHPRDAASSSSHAG